jgi:propionyl-CoA carboxylase alpha chain
VWVLGERDCSLQRRHQKVIEETPAPGLGDGLRRTLHEAAARATRSIGYTGAGTVEFLVSRDGRPYFLEMNTRLQVEHPVTECVTGLDLVALQIRVAEGAALPASPPGPRGHAIEARLYAEDPARGWQPQPGPLHLLELAGVDAEFTVPPGLDSGLRLDSGVTGGEVIGVHYDPMLAKVIAWAPTRAEAVRRLAHALERARLHGPATNRDLLVRALRHPDFAAARLDTGFLERHLAALTGEPEASGSARLAGAPAESAGDAAGDTVRFAALAAALADAADRTSAAGPVPLRLGGWRNVPSQPQLKRFRSEPDGREYQVGYRLTRTGLEAPGYEGVRLVSAAPRRVVLDIDGVRRAFDVAAYGETYAERVFVDSPFVSSAFRVLARFAAPQDLTPRGSLLAPMPGTVIRIGEFSPGDRVEKGRPLLWLEAMKMEHVIAAPTTGTLTELTAEVGRQVDVGAVLAVVKEDTTP